MDNMRENALDRFSMIYDLSKIVHDAMMCVCVRFNDVKASSQNFGLGLWHFDFGLVNYRPRKCAIQCKIILVVSISWLCRSNVHYKDVVKH